ncbi:hypothetical protein TNCV_2534691 [Trichonephila clavipes]|nr:hypothetical protein TNCV_2534691 [Trichonephila clavipes]
MNSQCFSSRIDPFKLQGWVTSPPLTGGGKFCSWHLVLICTPLVRTEQGPWFFSISPGPAQLLDYNLPRHQFSFEIYFCRPPCRRTPKSDSLFVCPIDGAYVLSIVCLDT